MCGWPYKAHFLLKSDSARGDAGRHIISIWHIICRPGSPLGILHFEPNLGYRYQFWYNVRESLQVKSSCLSIDCIKLDLLSWLRKRMSCDWLDLGALQAYFHPRKLHLSLHNSIHHCHNPSWSNLEETWGIQKYRLVDSLPMMRIRRLT